MDAQIQPMTLGDMFEKTFTLIGRTFVRNLIVGAIFLIVPIILMTSAMRHFFMAISQVNALGGNETLGSGLQGALEMIRLMSIFWATIILLAVCTLLAEIVVCIIVSKEFKSEHIDVGAALGDTFDKKWLYGIGQILLKDAILIGGAAVGGIAVAILAAVVASVSEGAEAFFVAVMVVVIIAMMVALIFFAIKWYFSLAAVAVDGLGPTESLRKSWQLVKGYWWRTLGILILFWILSQFVISIISLPITFASMWGFYKHFFTMLGNTNGQLDMDAFRELQRSLGPAIGLGSGVSSLLTLLISPVYTVVMYYDLRARKNDFPIPEVPAAAQITPPAPSV